MPFKSEKQRKWMHANDPKMAKKWEKEEKMKKETKVRSLIRKMVREIMKEDFAGAYPKEHRKKFDNIRRKQSEVLGYKLMGTPDVRTEIGNATVHQIGHKLNKSVNEEKIEKAYDRYWYEVKDLQKILNNKGLKKEAKMLNKEYTKRVLGFQGWLRGFMDKLL